MAESLVAGVPSDGSGPVTPCTDEAALGEAAKPVAHGVIEIEGAEEGRGIAQSGEERRNRLPLVKKNNGELLKERCNAREGNGEIFQSYVDFNRLSGWKLKFGIEISEEKKNTAQYALTLSQSRSIHSRHN